MSRYLKFIIAAAAVLALATPALAIEADFSGFMQIRGVSSNNLDGTDTTTVAGSAAFNDQGNAVDSRFRLYTKAAVNENVAVNFRIEVDYFWGDTGVGDPGADATGAIEVKAVYLDFNLPDINTNVKAGTQFFSLGRGMLLFDDMSGLYVRKAINENQNLGFVWVKPFEGSGSAWDDDGDFYYLEYAIKSGDTKIAPYLAWYDMVGDAEAYYLGFDLDAKAGPVGLAFTLVGNQWDNDDTKTDGEGVIAYGKASYKAGAATLSAEAAYWGDSNTTNGQFVSPRRYYNFAEVVTGGVFDGRTGAAGTGNTVTTTSTAAAPYQANWTFGKLGVVNKIGDKSKVSAYYIYARETFKSGAGRGARVMGHELDAYYDYTIDKGLTLTVGGGYLLADDDFGAGDDAYKVGTALTYKF